MLTFMKGLKMSYDPKDADTIKAVKAAVDEAVAEVEETHASAVEGLKAKNVELLGKLKKAREGKEDSGEVARLETELEKSNADLKAANTSLKAVTKERDTLKVTVEQETKFSRTELTEARLTDELVAANIKKEFLPAVKKLLADKLEVVVEGDKRTVTFAGKPLKEGIATFAQSDEGKIYVLAPANGGGNAQGGKATLSNDDLAKLPPVERINAAREAGKSKGT